MESQESKLPGPGYWGSRIAEWVCAGVVGMLISIPISVLIARHYYERSLHDSQAQLQVFRSVVNDAIREGLVEAQYNARGEIVALHRPYPPTGFTVH